MSTHSLLTGADLHQPWHYVQESDPGAIGAGQTWFKKSTKTISYRNDANSGWISILASSSTNALPSGTTWSEFNTAYNATDPGDTLELPNSEIIQDVENMYIGGKPIRIRGSGPNSKIRFVVPGSNFAQLYTGWSDTSPTPIFLENFIIEHDRTEMTSTGRCIAIRVHGGSYGVYIKNITFLDITSDCVCLIGNSLVDANNLETRRPIDGVYFEDCTVTEWYESVFNIHGIGGTSVKNVYCERVACTVSSPHPDGSISRPYCLNVDVEEDDTEGGLLKNVQMHKNTFVSTMTGGGYTNSLGLSIKKHGTQTGMTYTDIYATGNVLDNWYSPCQVVTINEGSQIESAYVYIYGNTFKWPGNECARIDPAGAAGDIVFIGNNDFYFSPGKEGLSLPGTWGPDVTVVQNPPNRDHEE